MIFNFYEGKNVIQSYVYNHYLHIIDPFYMPKKSLSQKIKRKSNRISKGLPSVDERPIRFLHRYDKYLKPGFSSIEFKILDFKLLQRVENHKGDFMIDRYIIEWETKKYFLKRCEGTLYRVEGNIAIFFLKQYDMINEDILLSWERENILTKLLN
jgi:hypothetical protein